MESQFSGEALKRLHKNGVIAVLAIDELEDAEPLARALLAGGIEIMELTLRTPVAVDAIKAVLDTAPDMTVGAGTVLTPQQVRMVADAGAAFAVAPGFNRRVVQAAKEESLAFAPGVAIPSDIELAIEAGCREMKFFPAEPSGGIGYLKSVAAPYRHLGIQFIPLGGLNAANMASYLTESINIAVGGSWLAPRDLIRQKNWEMITEYCLKAREIVKRIRGFDNE